VEAHLDVGGGAMLLAHRAREARLQRLHQHLSVDTLFARDLAQRVQDLVVHGSTPLRSTPPPASPRAALPDVRALGWRSPAHGSTTKRAVLTAAHSNHCSSP